MQVVEGRTAYTRKAVLCAIMRRRFSRYSRKEDIGQ